MHTLIGAEFSYYSGKTRSYLLHKKIPFTEKSATAWTYLVEMPRRVGAPVVPVVHTPQDEWLQDTSVIMDSLEARFPANPALPSSPVLRIASYLFELWGDEFLLPLAMHTRWNRPEHFAWYAQDAGKVLMPGWPGFVQRFMGRKIAASMDGLRMTLGFDEGMTPVLDAFGKIQLDGLNAHFAQHKFLFGDRPSYGDYGLIGPLYAHIGRDPLSKRDLIDTRPALAAWIARMFNPDTSTDGEFDCIDEPAQTLAPALLSIFDEMVPFIQASADALRKTPVVEKIDRLRNPQSLRFLTPVRYPMAGSTHQRHAVPYAVWQAQRMLNVFATMSAADQNAVRAWLQKVGGENVLALDLPPVQRYGLMAIHVRPEHTR